MKTLQLGGHVSAAGGIFTCFENAKRIGANTIQIFGASPRQWKARLHSGEAVKRFQGAWKESEVVSVYLHAPYLINLASPDTSLRKKSVEALMLHLQIADQLASQGVIFHIGSGKELSKDQAIRYVVSAMKEILSRVPGTTQLIVENAAGGGQKLGATPEELGTLIRAVGSSRVKICFDTAHAFEAGLIDAFTPKKVHAMLSHWQKTVGLKHIVALHVNDSKTTYNSHHDRHENLGKGHIGLSGFQNLASEKRLHDKAWILEVPGFDGNGPDKKNLDLLKQCFSS